MRDTYTNVVNPEEGIEDKPSPNPIDALEE
jgi:hypothetical protein